MFTCTLCGKTFTNKKGFSHHLSRTEKLKDEELFIAKFNCFFPKENLDNLISLYVEDAVEFPAILKKAGLCVADLSPILVLRGVKRTVKESHQTKGYKQRLENGVFASLGVKNPSQAEVVKNKKVSTFIKKYGVKLNLQIPSIREKANATWLKNSKANTLAIKQAVFDKYGVINIAQIPSVKIKNGEFHRKRFAAMTDDQRRESTAAARAKLVDGDSWCSGIESRVYNICLKLFKNVEQHIFLFDYNYDLRIGNNLIEINGDFWHANPAHGYMPDDELLAGWFAKDVWKKDENKRDKAISAGYNYTVLWESEINNMSDFDIITFLKGNIYV